MPLPLYDLHTHSHHSFDSEETVENLCKGAVERGLAGIALTNHTDFGPYLDEDWQARLESSLEEAGAASQRHAGLLEVLRGIELGQPLQDIEKAERTLLAHDFDVVVMGLHNAAGRADYYWLDYAKEDADELLTEYFDELYKMVCWGGFDVLAHIGYPLRYINKHRAAPFDLAPYNDRIDAILAVLADGGKALEINTAGLNRGGGEVTADLDQLCRFRRLGGRYVTLGSDAHAAHFVGGCFAEGVAMLRAAGFDSVTHYRGRKPILTRI